MNKEEDCTLHFYQEEVVIRKPPKFGFMIFKYGFWLRLFGKLVWVAKDNSNPPLFSERNGYWNVWKKFGLKVKVETETPKRK